MFQNKKFLILLGVLGAIFLTVYYFWILRTPREEEFLSLEQQQKQKVSPVSFEIFENKVFRSLVRYGDFPIKARFSGRNNPFTPYW